MDAVSRDALTETEQTLTDLAGFLQAVQEAPDGGRDPALDETAVQIMGVATRLRTFVLRGAKGIAKHGAGRTKGVAESEIVANQTSHVNQYDRILTEAQ